MAEEQKRLTVVTLNPHRLSRRTRAFIETATRLGYTVEILDSSQLQNKSEISFMWLDEAGMWLEQSA
jgi:hypothetical protein